eukprot:TRINITY_DN35905_c0_g1_i2.p2 TRINITY_DN35905_c0_g1~~TRINITY_DN35905_c0_g1_i2.p2  ORF type:complete len:102 (+),score=17.81 TRINITY_DN35905_c0_g1_i2:357-662(+)
MYQVDIFGHLQHLFQVSSGENDISEMIWNDILAQQALWEKKVVERCGIEEYEKKLEKVKETCETVVSYIAANPPTEPLSVLMRKVNGKVLSEEAWQGMTAR